MSLLEGLNEKQQEAVQHFEGPLLILAGAGSGKTRVLTNRIAWLIEEKEVNPWYILAITFTNKAAGEMRERIERLVGYGSDSIWTATFHSTCGRILRRFIDRIGYGTNYTIYDTDDQKTLIKNICKKLQIDTKIYRERALMAAISSAKDELIGPEEYSRSAGSDSFTQKAAEVYKEYQKSLKESNALDFDDMLRLTVQLFEECPDVLDYYQNRFRFILVDEYQDTNTAQFRLISLLAGKRRNLCVVGDDDQSIYRFRGANIMNILNFEKIFPDAKVIRLEQNYRSTGKILETANHVIRNNRGRKEKTLWTENEEGSCPRFCQFHSANREAEFIAEDIAKAVRSGEYSYGDCAVLYRTNAQSRLLEEKMLYAGIPYKLIGGVNFYARREVKDMLSYLRMINNPNDEMSILRVINVPRRGIGAASITKVQNYADINNLHFSDALKRAAEIPGIGRTGKKIAEFSDLFRKMQEKSRTAGIRELLNYVLEETAYRESLEEEDAEEAKDRIANIEELVSKIAAYEENTEMPTLDGFLQEVSLVADIDDLESEQGYVILMTLHSAKGLEFPRVYMSGMEDGIFPGFQALNSFDSTDDMEEERRLCYVGITRAMKDLTFTYARTRMHNGQLQYNPISQFIEEIPEDLLIREDEDEFGFDLSPGAVYGTGSKTGTRGREWTGTDRTRIGAADREEPFSQQRPRNGKEHWRNAMEAFHEKPYSQSTTQKPAAKEVPAYTEGDRVRHIKFGEGTVRKIVDGGRDYEVTVDFDRSGTKKMFAGFAKLVKI